MKISTIAILVLCTLSITINAQMTEVSGFQNPESVIACKKHLFVSNLGGQLDGAAKDGDGFISMLSRKDGKMIEEKFITGLNSPKGMQIRHGKLIVVDVDKIVIFKIKSKKKIKEIDLSKEGITYANDLTIVGRRMFVSETLKNVVYKVRRSGKIKELAVKNTLPGANGLGRGCGKLYIANFGRDNAANGGFGRIDRSSKKYTEYQTGGAYDGIVKVCHRLVVTDWVSPTENKGRIVVYDLRKETSSVVDINRTIDGPADLFADCKTKMIWIPAMRENKIIGIPFETIKK